MKKIFLTTTALILCAGAATAEVTVSGDARLGAKYIEDHAQQSSRVRVKFKMKYVASNGVEYGANLRGDQANKGKTGAAGHVYASGSFGKLRFGNLDSASYFANDELHNIYLEGNDEEEFLFFSTKAVTENNPSILYEFTTGNTTLYASVMDGDAGKKNDEKVHIPEDFEDAKGVGIKYNTDGYTLAAGYEVGTEYEVNYEKKAADDEDDPTKTVDDLTKIESINEIKNTRTTISAEMKLDSYKIKGSFSTGKKGDQKIHQYGGSGEYTNGAFKMAAFVKQQKEEASGKGKDQKINFSGIGASYDLSKNATLKGGVLLKKTDGKKTEEYADFGVTLKF